MLLPDEQSLYEFTWQHIKWVYKGFVFVYLTRNVDDITKRYSLTLKFRSNIYSTLIDSIQQATTETANYWASFLFNMTEFVSKLHQEQLELCAPIEFCCFSQTP